MKTLASFLDDVEKRKLILGFVETPASVEAMRNKGDRRTEAKRELLRRAADRAKAAGRTPVVAYY